MILKLMFAGQVDPASGGVNTTDSAVQMQHLLGISVYCADERSQLKNKNKAMTVLRSRLLQKKQQEENEKYAPEQKKPSRAGDRSERIRTYNFPQSRITDHRVNYTSHALQETLMGELDHVIEILEKEELANCRQLTTMNESLSILEVFKIK